MSYVLDIRYNFLYIIPEVILKKLEEVFLSAIRSKNDELCEFLIECLVIKVKDKLKNTYSDRDVPIIISISLSTLTDGILTHSVFTNTTLVDRSIEAIKKALKEESNSDIKRKT